MTEHAPKDSQHAAELRRLGTVARDLSIALTSIAGKLVRGGTPSEDVAEGLARAHRGAYNLSNDILQVATGLYDIDLRQLDPLADLRAIYDRIAEVFPWLAAADAAPKRLTAAWTLHTLGWRADQPVERAHELLHPPASEVHPDDICCVVCKGRLGGCDGVSIEAGWMHPACAGVEPPRDPSDDDITF